MRRFLAAAALGLAAVGPLGCAPRQSRTHFDRWADETKKRHAEEAEAKADQAKKPSDATVAAPAPAPKPAAAPPAKTATAALARPIAKPAEPPVDKKSADDDAIY